MFCVSSSTTAADLYGCCCDFWGGKITAVEAAGAIHLPIPALTHSPGKNEAPEAGTPQGKGGGDTTKGQPVKPMGAWYG